MEMVKEKKVIINYLKLKEKKMEEKEIKEFLELEEKEYQRIKKYGERYLKSLNKIEYTKTIVQNQEKVSQYINNLLKLDELLKAVNKTIKLTEKQEEEIHSLCISNFLFVDSDFDVHKFEHIVNDFLIKTNKTSSKPNYVSVSEPNFF